MPRPNRERTIFRCVAPPTRPARRLRRFLAAEVRRLQPEIRASAAACEAERYRKHFDSVGHVGVLLFHGLNPGLSLRQSYAALCECATYLTVWGLRAADDADDGLPAVSFSQVAASSTSRPADLLLGLLPGLLRRVQQTCPRRADAPPAGLHCIDATFLHLSHQLADWIPERTRANATGYWLQFEYTPADDLVKSVVLSDTQANDVQRLDALLFETPADLAALADETLVMDLGFYSHARFARLRTAGVHFVTRLHPQAATANDQDLLIQQPLPQLPESCRGRILVRRDRRLTVGSPNNRAGAVLEDMRVVRATVEPTPTAARRGATAVTYDLLTDRWDLSAEAVVQWYLWRWEIELFFRWLKRSLGLLRPLGHSQNAIEMSLWLALIVHLLCLLASAASGRQRRSPCVLASLPWLLVQLSLADLHADDSPRQLSLPGFHVPDG